MDYCNIVVAGENDAKITFIEKLMTDENDRVLSNWWAKAVGNTKVNIWTNGANNHIIWGHIDVVLLVANLSDPQVIEQLNRAERFATQIIVIGLYKQASTLTETLKLKALEWSAQQDGDIPFIEVDLSSDKCLQTWYQIIDYSIEQKKMIARF